jgi:hypothetical protein
LEQLETKLGYNFGFRHGFCEECGGRCCTGESGYIWISEEEAKKVASFLSMDMDSFAKNYLFVVKGRLSIIEKEYNGGYACIFFDEKAKNCSIYEVRPAQCRSFPFWDYYKNNTQEALKECPALIVL